MRVRIAKPCKCNNLQYGSIEDTGVEKSYGSKSWLYDTQKDVGSTHLHQLHAAQALLGNTSDQLVCFSWQQPARLGPARAGHEGGVQGIDVIW